MCQIEKLPPLKLFLTNSAPSLPFVAVKQMLQRFRRNAGFCHKHHHCNFLSAFSVIKVFKCFQKHCRREVKKIFISSFIFVCSLQCLKPKPSVYSNSGLWMETLFTFGSVESTEWTIGHQMPLDFPPCHLGKQRESLKNPSYLVVCEISKQPHLRLLMLPKRHARLAGQKT